MCTIVTLASFIQLRDVVCVSYDIYTVFLSNRSVCITHDDKYVLLRNTEYVERWYCYLWIGYIFFTWLNIRVIILVNILYCSFIFPLVEKHWPKSDLPACLRDRSIGHPCSKWCLKKTLVSHLFQNLFADFYFIQTVLDAELLLLLKSK